MNREKSSWKDGIADLIRLGDRVTVGASEHPDTTKAGFAAVEQALIGVAQGSVPQAALLFSTSRHEPRELLRAVKSKIPEGVPVYGGYAVGIITNDFLAYDGFQVGVALFWLSTARLDVFLERGLNLGEAAVGERLFGRVSAQHFNGDPSLLLLYDSVNRTGGKFRLNMATSIVAEGFNKIDENISIVGAGLVGDMQCRTTHQWVGNEVDSQAALLLAFSGGLEIQQVVMHGCRPVSAYHEVTKTDHNVILEIDGRPALDVISELLGPESGRSWRDYSFFVTLGVNKGERYGAFKPEMYANRMCMNVDLARKGLVMFEPDLRPGNLFQLMLRDIDLSYISENIRLNLAKNAPRKPIFALYIDCAGRACAYSHMDEEEATYVQSALDGVCPLLGFYSGVEIARMAAKPQALDWTGVLCLFYERELPIDCAPIRLKSRAASSEPEKAHLPNAEPELSKKQLLEALSYYKRNLDFAAGQQVRFDAHMSSVSRALRQREQGFWVLANLKRNLSALSGKEQIFQDTLARIISSMAVDRALILCMDESGRYRVAAASGYSEEEKAKIAEGVHSFPDSFFAVGHLIANKSETCDTVQIIRHDLRLPFFVAVPIVMPRLRAILMAGRHREMKPFFPPFDRGDVVNFEAIASFLASIVDNVELYSDVQKMAASFRRFVPEAFLKILNRSDFKEIELGDHVARSMAVLVCDIRCFTTLCERMDPQGVFAFVNEFLSEIGPVVRRRGGFINEYLGDAIMALFEEPSDALRSAIEIIRQIDLFNERRRNQGKFSIQVGVGVNSGDLMLGTIGEAERIQGSVVADAVNLCFRLESLTKIYGAQILTTDTTLKLIPDRNKITVRPVDLVVVKGKRNHVTVVEILDGNSRERLKKKLETRERYESAFQSFEYGAYDEAEQKFRAIARIDPKDRAARVMMTKARKLAEGNPFVEE